MNYSAFAFAVLALCVGCAVASSAPKCPKEEGALLPSEDCTKYWQCCDGVPLEKDCPKGLHFNAETCVCDWPEKQPTKPSTTTAAPVTNPAIPCPEDYSKQAYFPDCDCTKFWQCSNGLAYELCCPDGLHFNPKLNVCDWPESACCTGEGWSTITTTPTTTTEEPCTEDENNVQE